MRQRDEAQMEKGFFCLSGGYHEKIIGGSKFLMDEQLTEALALSSQLLLIMYGKLGLQ